MNCNVYASTSPIVCHAPCGGVGKLATPHRCIVTGDIDLFNAQVAEHVKDLLEQPPIMVHNLVGKGPL